MTSYPFKGMLVGSANRWSPGNGLPGDAPTDDFDPRALWRLWESFGISSASMRGWWLPAAERPVATNDTAVKVTSYVRDASVLIVLATFAPHDCAVTLAIDWDALGLDEAKSHLRAPSLPPIQDPETVFAPDAALPIAGDSGGWLLLLEPSSR